ncbi:serine/threonine protein kinase [Hamadaea tsunoensis]|uniref:serine/threonine protein kinase n=1 Tax=Hamadaea tsunoensis TaxID=53368 RepID=UPI00042664CD|nr:serine/threonine-protein kinase [Hamadaea tsunoensis]
MSGVRDLRPNDGQDIGGYRLLGRLGEGGMGTVFLAEDAGGTRVAIKVIRDHLLERDEYRERFRGEVERAKTVPPFCTAEVLDADPDHEPPYLVVEYVDGPSLAEVVAEAGPLRGTSLHSLGIGMATALTAIHGANVIHRDLKPGNVLLPRGGVKVIDFGLARDVDTATGITRTDQVMGTVPYISPERLGGASFGGLRPVTAAADVFAWGAVMTYAATGRTPFGGDTPASTAVRILTSEPDLDGIGGALRDIIARTLAKDPADRPTARDLLDELMSTGATRSGVPKAVIEPAKEAQAGGAELTRADVGTTSSVPIPRLRSGRGRKVLTAVAAVLVLAAVAAGGVYFGTQHRTFAAGPGAGPSTPASAGASAAATPSASVAANGDVVPAGFLPAAQDTLDAAGLWHERTDVPNKATCHVSGGVHASVTGPTYRCPGPKDELTDTAAFVDVTLLSAASCAGIWFRFDDAARGGYALEICQDGALLIRQESNDGKHWSTPHLRTMQYPSPMEVGVSRRFGVVAQGPTMTLYADGKAIGVASDSSFDHGRVAIGVLQRDEVQAGQTYEVLFRNIDLYGTSWARPHASASATPGA